MLQRFLDSTDAAQVMELMRAAELTALQITDEVHWTADASTWSTRPTAARTASFRQPATSCVMESGVTAARRFV